MSAGVAGALCFMRRSSCLLGLLALSLFGLTGCNSCSSDKPYTPFGVASLVPPEPSAEPPPAASAPSAAPTTSASGFPERKSLLAPVGAKHFPLPDGALDAPPAHAFVQVLPADFDGSGKLGALAWLASDPDAPKDTPPGELWYYPNGRPPVRLLALPGFVPTGPGCALEPALAQTGPRSATLDVSAHCAGQLLARAPERALVVVSPASARPVLVTLRLAAPAPGESAEYHVDSSDQDQDGRDDVRVTVSVAGPSAPEPASAELVWLDRPAGTSRSSDEPKNSLAGGAAKLAVRAKQRHFPQLAERAGSWLRLAATLCAEGGVPRVFDADGAPLRCGDLTSFADAFTSATVQGALAQGDPLAAFAAYAREGWYFTHVSKSVKTSLERELSKATARVEITEAQLARAVPFQPKTPHYAPLWFEADGSLLVRGMTGVTRVSPDGASEQALDADAGVAPWPLDVGDSAGKKLTGLAHACDRAEILLLTSDAAGAPQPPLVSSLLAARPASCGGRNAVPPTPVAPLAFDGPLPALLIAGAPTLPADPKALASLPALGSPRSADGRLLVVPTSLGLFVGGERKELWRLNKLKDHADATKLSDCVIQSDAKSIACIDSGKVVRYLRPTPPP